MAVAGTPCTKTRMAQSVLDAGWRCPLSVIGNESWKRPLKKAA